MNWTNVLIILVCLVWVIVSIVVNEASRQREVELKRRIMELESEQSEVKAYMESAEWKEISSSYIVTDSDVVRYKTAKDIYYNARKRIATNIGFDIVKHFQPEESLTESGNTKYTYTFKIRK